MMDDREQIRRELALRIAWNFLGVPYTWGGDDPSGFDCSGLIQEVAKSGGAYPRRTDETAHGMMRRFQSGGGEIPELDACPGDLVFFLNSDGRAIHVEMVVEDDGEDLYCIGASGGGPRAKDPEAAWKLNAYIKVRPERSIHSGLARIFVNPWRD